MMQQNINNRTLNRLGSNNPTSMHNYNIQYQLAKTDPLLSQYISPMNTKSMSSTTMRSRIKSNKLSLHPLNELKPIDNTTGRVSVVDKLKKQIRDTKAQHTERLEVNIEKSLNLKKTTSFYYFSGLFDIINSTKRGILAQLCQQQLTQLQQIVTQIHVIPSITQISLSPLNSQLKFNKTIAIDLDETLIHSEPYDMNKQYDHVIRGPGNSLGIFVRPFCAKFLSELSQLCEIVVYTASTQQYAASILNIIDPLNIYFKACLDRKHCSQLQNAQIVKNVAILGRDLKSTVLIDNSPQCFIPNLYNSIPIIPFLTDREDIQLQELLQFLKKYILPSQNVQLAIKQQMKYSSFRAKGDGIQIVRKILEEDLNEH